MLVKNRALNYGVETAVSKLATKQSRLAMTLVELLIVVVAVGIVAVLSLPLLPRMMEAARAREAVIALKQIRTAEKMFRSTTGYYYPHYQSETNPQEDEAEINRVFKVFIDTRESLWRYQVESLAADQFMATATRTGGRQSNETLTIDQDGDLRGSWSLPLTGKLPEEE